MKVYIVSHGYYSDKSINSVWSTLELAQAHIDREKELDAADENRYPHDWNDIVEWDVDPGVAELASGLFGYIVEFDGRGNVVRADRIDGAFTSGEYSRGNRPSEKTQWIKAYYITQCYAKDAEHAIKIAADRRAAWLAGGGE